MIRSCSVVHRTGEGCRRCFIRWNVSFLFAVLMAWGAAALTAQPVTAQDLGAAGVVSVREVIYEDGGGMELKRPVRLFYDPVNRETYELDAGNRRILVLARDFFPILSIGASDGINVPVAMAVDSAGNVFVAQAPDQARPYGRISVLNASLGWEKDIRFDDIPELRRFEPFNLALGKTGLMYVTGREHTAVAVLDRDGKFLRVLTVEDDENGSSRKQIISDVETDDNGNIYLLSDESGSIYVYDSQEKFRFRFGQKGGAEGKLARPRGLAVDNRLKRVYVVDYMRHTVITYSMDGRYIFEFGGLGWEKGWFQYPSDICVDGEGNILVADTFNNRVQVMSISPKQ